jgi:hypothetical protein
VSLFSTDGEKGSDAKIVENVHSRVASQSEENAKRSSVKRRPSFQRASNSESVATRRRPRRARLATARAPLRAIHRLAARVFRRVAVKRTWQMSHMGLALALNATRSCLATTALAEWMLREPVG